jgi:hypothetical protein
MKLNFWLNISVKEIIILTALYQLHLLSSVNLKNDCGSRIVKNAIFAVIAYFVVYLLMEVANFSRQLNRHVKHHTAMSN